MKFSGVFPEIEYNVDVMTREGTCQLSQRIGNVAFYGHTTVLGDMDLSLLVNAADLEDTLAEEQKSLECGLVIDTWEQQRDNLQEALSIALKALPNEHFQQYVLS